MGIRFEKETSFQASSPLPFAFSSAVSYFEFPQMVLSRHLGSFYIRWAGFLPRVWEGERYIFFRYLETIKGQWGVPLTVYPWYLLCSLGILGDYNP